MRILDIHEFNGKTYTRVEYDDGTVVELKNVPEDKVIETATQIKKLAPPEPKPIVTIADCTDEELTAEVTRRNLTLKVRGAAI
jgi:hypothetical protein